MNDSVSKNVKVENDSSRPAGFEPGLSVLERYAVKVARTVLRGGGDGNVASLPDSIIKDWQPNRERGLRLPAGRRSSVRV